MGIVTQEELKRENQGFYSWDYLVKQELSKLGASSDKELEDYYDRTESNLLKTVIAYEFIGINGARKAYSGWDGRRAIEFKWMAISGLGEISDMSCGEGSLLCIETLGIALKIACNQNDDETFKWASSTLNRVKSSVSLGNVSGMDRRMEIINETVYNVMYKLKAMYYVNGAKETPVFMTDALSILNNKKVGVPWDYISRYVTDEYREFIFKVTSSILRVALREDAWSLVAVRTLMELNVLSSMDNKGYYKLLDEAEKELHPHETEKREYLKFVRRECDFMYKEEDFHEMRQQYMKYNKGD
jgi:hypothetical protein